MSPLRLIIEPQATPGAWNMAVDETLLESALARELCTVRIYQWSAPTVSLGYFQDADVFERDPQWTGLPAVRRLSGGGAILHDGEITYSISLPPGQQFTSHPSQLYVLVHNALIDVLAQHGVTARMRGDSRGSIVHRPSSLDSSSINHQPSTINPFLCFGRGDPNDIVFGAHKIVGSAQRRRRGAILQHGSLLLERSPHAPDFPGISELTGVLLDRAAFSHQIGEAIVAALGARSEPAVLNPDELARAQTLERDRYRSLRWRTARDGTPSDSRSNDN